MSISCMAYRPSGFSSIRYIYMCVSLCKLIAEINALSEKYVVYSHFSFVDHHHHL